MQSQATIYSSQIVKYSTTTHREYLHHGGSKARVYIYIDMYHLELTILIIGTILYMNTILYLFFVDSINSTHVCASSIHLYNT
jgi:hypothetical protein